jgi:folate-dependent phosphoribosylglycinamide formyltransferase PurN
MATKWIAFFSQTGSEIAEVSEHLGRWPDLIVTNKRPDEIRTIDSRIVEYGYTELPNKPTVDDLETVLQDNAVITLHGWLRIMPPIICNKYLIFNGHPGLITQYPELKGKDPQIKAFNLKHEVMGCVIHKVTAGVDEGKVLKETFFNAWQISEEDMWKTFKDRSCYLWNEFLEELVGNTK